MNQNRKDQDVPNRQSNMEQAEGARRPSHGTERNRSEESTRDDGQSLIEDDSLDGESDRSDRTGGMGSSGERGFGSEQDRSMGRGRTGSQGGGISNRPLDEERDRQNRLPERGRSQSEE